LVVWIKKNSDFFSYFSNLASLQGIYCYHSKTQSDPFTDRRQTIFRNDEFCATCRLACWVGLALFTMLLLYSLPTYTRPSRVSIRMRPPFTCIFHTLVKTIFPFIACSVVNKALKKAPMCVTFLIQWWMRKVMNFTLKIQFIFYCQY
jgi:hypothetical protein